ncbi:hypothetical protein BDD12DRAFT_910573 [Trichophaea hybrida]|nr:hypothetical protein BDD12DRAFT_910573 [Trichophaea hybrida]
MFLFYLLILIFILAIILILTHRHTTMSNQNIILYPDGTFILRDAPPNSSSSDIPGMFVVPANGPSDVTPPQPTQLLKSLPAAQAKWLVQVQPAPPPPPQFSLQKWQAAQVSVKQQPAAVQVPAWAFSPPPAIWDERTATVYTDKKPEWRILPSGSGTASPPTQGNGSRVVWKFGPSRPPKRKSPPPPPPPSPPPPKKPCLAPDHSSFEFTPFTILPSRSFSSRFRDPNLLPILIPEKKKLGVLEVDPKLYVACMADVATPKEAELKLPGMREREKGEVRLPGVSEVVAEGMKWKAEKKSGKGEGRGSQSPVFVRE